MMDNTAQENQEYISAYFKIKKSCPIIKQIEGISYIVGILTYDEKDISTDQYDNNNNNVDDNDDHICPPVIMLMNFAKTKSMNQNKDNDDYVINSNKKTNQQINVYTDNDIKNLRLNLDFEKNIIVKDIIKKFFDYQSFVPACCDYMKRFWEWVFMMYPESGFKWNFKRLSNIWFEYMLSFIDFRESFKNWLLEYELNILKDMNAIINGDIYQIINNMKILIDFYNIKICENHSKIKYALYHFTPQDLKNEINNNGFLLPFEESIEQESKCSTDKIQDHIHQYENYYMNNFCSNMLYEEKFNTNKIQFAYNDIIDDEDENNQQKQEINKDEDYDKYDIKMQQKILEEEINQLEKKAKK